MVALAWSSLRYHQYARPDTPKPWQLWLQNDLFWGGELWFLVFKLKKKERERKRSKKRTTQQEMGIFLQNEESNFQEAGIGGGLSQSRLLNHSLPFPILCSTAFWVLLLKEAGGKTTSGPEGTPEVTEHPSSSLYRRADWGPERGSSLPQMAQQTQNQIFLDCVPVTWCENGSQAEPQKGLLFYRLGALKVSNSQTWFTDPRVCLVVAKVIATFSIAFQN